MDLTRLFAADQSSPRATARPDLCESLLMRDRIRIQHDELDPGDVTCAYRDCWSLFDQPASEPDAVRSRQDIREFKGAVLSERDTQDSASGTARKQHDLKS